LEIYDLLLSSTAIARNATAAATVLRTYTLNELELKHHGNKAHLKNNSHSQASQTALAQAAQESDPGEVEVAEQQF
jgi:hypothetical protein